MIGSPSRIRVALSMACVALASVQARAQHELAWKLKPGQELIFTRSFDQTTQVNNGPENRNSYVETIHWRVVRVEPDGSARVTQTLDRVQGRRPLPNRVLGAKVEMIDFDSYEDYPAGSPQVQMLDLPRKQIEFGEFSFTLTSQGEVVDLVDSEKIKKFRSADEKNAQRLFGENVLRMSIPSVLLPKGEVKIGTSWAEKPTFDDFRLPAQVLSTKYRASGKVEREGHQLDEIEYETETDNMITLKAPFPQVLKEFRCQGKILFDADSGRMLERTRETSSVIVPSQAGRTMEQKLQRIEVITLLPPAEKPAK